MCGDGGGSGGDGACEETDGNFSVSIAGTAGPAGGTAIGSSGGDYFCGGDPGDWQ